MRVLVACEFSGRVRDAFIARGHDAVSCDIEDTETSGPHIQGDVLSVLADGWDLMIAFPPCTYLCVSGARWWPGREKLQEKAIGFVRCLIAAPIPMVAIENPVGKLSTVIRKPDQIIQPWQYGCGETKATCFWLYGLPALKSTNVVSGRYPAVHRMHTSRNRSRNRSRTYPGVAAAMAEQWG